MRDILDLNPSFSADLRKLISKLDTGHGARHEEIIGEAYKGRIFEECP